MRAADVKEGVTRTGEVPAGDAAAAFAAFMAGERRRLGDVIAKTGIVLAD